jgi:uncharacterized protein YceK
LASAVGGFALGILVNLVTPLLTVQGIVLLGAFVVLTFVVAALRSRLADTLLSVVALWMSALGAVVATVIGIMVSPDPGGRLSWGLAVLLAAAAALVPQAAAIATAVMTGARRLLGTSRDLQIFVILLLVTVALMSGGGAVLSLIEGDFGISAVAATACVALAIATWWWARQRTELAATVSVAFVAPLIVGATASAKSGDMLSGALFAALGISFAGGGGARLLSRAPLRGLVAVGAAVFAGALFVASSLDEDGYTNYGYSELTWWLHGAVAVLFLIGGMGVLVQRTMLAAVTVVAGAAAVALAAFTIWRNEPGEWPFWLVYGVICVATGIRAVAASPIPGAVRRWSALLTAPRSTPAVSE